MGSSENRLRKKWQHYGGCLATEAEHSVFTIFELLFQDTEYEIIKQPREFSNVYVDVQLSQDEIAEIYTPPCSVLRHGIRPDGAIRNKNTGKTIYLEIKRQDGWVEGKSRRAGRGNAHERLCKYFTPGILKLLRRAGNIAPDSYPFWIIFQGDITRDPCRVREIRYWFDGNESNLFFWRDAKNADALVSHFLSHIEPLLE